MRDEWVYFINDCNITVDVLHFAELWLAHGLHTGVLTVRKFSKPDNNDARRFHRFPVKSSLKILDFVYASFELVTRFFCSLMLGPLYNRHYNKQLWQASRAWTMWSLMLCQLFLYNVTLNTTQLLMTSRKSIGCWMLTFLLSCNSSVQQHCKLCVLFRHARVCVCIVVAKTLIV